MLPAISAPVTKAVRDQLKAHLSDATYGINRRLQQTAASYPFPQAIALKHHYDFTAQSRSFIEAQVDAKALDLMGYTNFPRMLLYGESMIHTNYQKGTPFSGEVAFSLEFHLSYGGATVPAFADLYCDWYDEAMVLCVNDLTLQFWTGGVSYNGVIAGVRAPLIPCVGKSWIQVIKYTLQFGVDV